MFIGFYYTFSLFQWNLREHSKARLLMLLQPIVAFIRAIVLFHQRCQLQYRSADTPVLVIRYPLTQLSLTKVQTHWSSHYLIMCQSSKSLTYSKLCFRRFRKLLTCDRTRHDLVSRSTDAEGKLIRSQSTKSLVFHFVVLFAEI